MKGFDHEKARKGFRDATVVRNDAERSLIGVIGTGSIAENGVGLELMRHIGLIGINSQRNRAERKIATIANMADMYGKKLSEEYAHLDAQVQEAQSSLDRYCSTHFTSETPESLRRDNPAYVQLSQRLTESEKALSQFREEKLQVHLDDEEETLRTVQSELEQLVREFILTNSGFIELPRQMESHLISQIHKVESEEEYAPGWIMSNRTAVWFVRQFITMQKIKTWYTDRYDPFVEKFSGKFASVDAMIADKTRSISSAVESLEDSLRNFSEGNPNIARKTIEAFMVTNKKFGNLLDSPQSSE